MSKEIRRSLSIFIGIVVLLTSCSQVTASPPLSLDIQEGPSGHHLGVTAKGFTFAVPEEMVVGDLNG